MSNTYKPFLVKKLKDGSVVRDSTEWNIMVKSFPFKVYPDMKDVPKRDWVDENGDDEFTPDEPFFKAYEMECEFLFKGSHGTANTQIHSFIDYLSKNGTNAIYDSYTKIGKTKVRYVSYNPEIFHRREDKDDLVVFKLTLKVNDPVTNITLTK